jgi:hypothetical protein
MESARRRCLVPHYGHLLEIAWTDLQIYFSALYPANPSTSKCKGKSSERLAERGRGEDRAGPALNPLKGSSARLPPSGYHYGTQGAKPNLLKLQAFPKRPLGKKEIRPGKKFWSSQASKLPGEMALHLFLLFQQRIVQPEANSLNRRQRRPRRKASAKVRIRITIAQTSRRSTSGYGPQGNTQLQENPDAVARLDLPWLPC